MNDKCKKIIDQNSRGFNTTIFGAGARSNPYILRIYTVMLAMIAAPCLFDLTYADENIPRDSTRLDAHDITGALIIISMGPAASEPLAPLRLLENGVVGGIDTVAPKLSHPPLPGVTFSSNVSTSSWKVTDRSLLITWTTNSTTTLPGGSVKVTIKNEVTLTPEGNGSVWVGTTQCKVNSNTGKKHEETLPSKAKLMKNPLLEHVSEEAMQKGVAAFGESKLQDKESAYLAEKSTAEKLREQAAKDKAAVIEQMKRVEAVERDARATAAAGVDDPRQLGEATKKFEALETEKSKLAELKKTAAHSNELAILAEHKASKFQNIYELAKKNWDKISQTLGAIGPVGELIEGDFRRESLKSEGKYLSVWVNMFETVGAVTGSTITFLASFKIGPLYFQGNVNPMGQFLVELGFEEWSRQVGKAIGQATGKWTGLKDAPVNVSLEK